MPKSRRENFKAIDKQVLSQNVLHEDLPLIQILPASPSRRISSSIVFSLFHIIYWHDHLFIKAKTKFKIMVVHCIKYIQANCPRLYETLCMAWYYFQKFFSVFSLVLTFQVHRSEHVSYIWCSIYHAFWLWPEWFLAWFYCIWAISLCLRKQIVILLESICLLNMFWSP